MTPTNCVLQATEDDEKEPPEKTKASRVRRSKV